MGIVASIQAASWYPEVEATMQAAEVPDYLWMSIIASEDGSLNTGVVVQDYYTKRDANGNKIPAGDSYGLFQLNQNPQGVDPAYAARWAASKLGPALASAGTYTPDQAMSIAEQVAWPGMNSPPDDATRRANMQSVMSQLGWNYAATGTTSAPVSGVANVATQPNLLQQIQAIPGQVNSAINGTVQNVAAIPDTFNSAVDSWIPQIEQNVLIGGVILAVLAGGFALLAASE